MEVDLSFLQYIRIAILTMLFSLSVLSFRTIFKKIKLFGFGLAMLTGLLVVITAINYFFKGAYRPYYEPVYTLALLGWMIAWVIDLGSYEKD